MDFQVQGQGAGRQVGPVLAGGPQSDNAFQEVTQLAGEVQPGVHRAQSISRSLQEPQPIAHRAGQGEAFPRVGQAPVGGRRFPQGHTAAVLFPLGKGGMDGLQDAPLGQKVQGLGRGVLVQNVVQFVAPAVA